jgi:hypothetical protein
VFDFIKNRVDGYNRRSTITFHEKVLTPDVSKPTGQSTGPTGPTGQSTEKNIYSAEVIPNYKPDDSLHRPDSFTTKLTINGIKDRTSEIDKLNDAIQERKENIDGLTEQVKSATKSLTA